MQQKDKRGKGSCYFYCNGNRPQHTLTTIISNKMDTQKKEKNRITKLMRIPIRSIRILVTKTITAKSENEETAKKEFILNTILVGIIFLTFIAFTCTLLDSIKHGKDYNGLSPIITSLILFFFFFLYFLSRKSYVKLAAYLFIFAHLPLSLFFIIQWGIDLPVGPLFFILIIIMSGILVNTFFAISITTLILLAYFLIAHLQISGLISYENYWKQVYIRFSDVIIPAIIFLIVTTISWLSNRQIEKSFKKAKESEEKLKIERDQLEVTIKKKTKDLKQAQIDKISQLYRFAEFGKLSAGLFHDLINPLTSLSLNLNQIKDEEIRELNEAKYYLRQAIQTTKKMEIFVMTIKKQIQKQKTTLNFSINEEIIQSILLFSYPAKKNNITISFKQKNNIKTYGDQVKFSQIIGNLLANAIDSFEDCSKKDKRINIDLKEKDKVITLRIKDNGSGIPKEFLEDIWKPFFTTKSFKDGTGIGLSSTKNIIEHDFQGKIKLKTSLKEGTVFIVSFPTKKIKPQV